MDIATLMKQQAEIIKKLLAVIQGQREIIMGLVEKADGLHTDIKALRGEVAELRSFHLNCPCGKKRQRPIKPSDVEKVR